MPIEIDDILLSKIHKIQTLEVADFVSHRIPGLNGNVIQDMGRKSVRLQIEGIYYGENVAEDLSALREIHKSREPVDFLAEIVETAYFSQVVIERIEVNQQANFPEQFGFRLIVAEYVPPPEPLSGGLGLDGFPEVDTDIGLDALDFMDALELPDLFSIPALQDPTQPLSEVEGQINQVFDGIGEEELGNLGALFSGSPDQTTRSLGGNSDSLFESVNTQVDQSAVQGVITDQQAVIGGADGDLDEILGQVLAGLQEVLNWISNTALPQLSQPGVIQDAFSDLEGIIPADTSSLTSGFATAIEDFVSDIDVGFASQLSGILEAFESINDLRLRLTTSEEETATRGLAPIPLSRSISPTNELAAQIGQLVDILPDPLNASTFLPFLLDALRAIPRQRFPIGYMPVYDELTEKLETTLTWLDMEVEDIEAQIIDTLHRLSAFIQQAILTENTGTIASQLTSIHDQIDDTSLSAHLAGAISGLESLSQAVSIQDLTGTATLIQETSNHFTALSSVLEELRLQIFSGQQTQLLQSLARLEDESEARMIQLIALLSPPSELGIIKLISVPFNDFLAQSGISSITESVRSLFSVVRDLLDKLNIGLVTDSREGGISEATNAIDGLRNSLTGVTLDISLLMDEVSNFIQDIGISDIKQSFLTELVNFEQLVEQGADTVFEPVRDVLQTGIDALIDVFGFINVQAIIDELIHMLDTLEGILQAEDTVEAIGKIREALTTVNSALASFSIESAANTVVDIINAVKSAFEIISSIPLTGSLLDEIVQEIEKNEILSPDALESSIDQLLALLRDVIEKGPKTVLLAIKDKPAELVDYISTFSPDQYLNDSLFQPYRDFLTKLEDFQPSLLVAPLQDSLDELKGDIQESLDPEKLLLPLEPSFDQVKSLITQIDPQEIIGPINEVLQEGIQSVTDHLPLDVTNEAFDHVADFGNELQEVVDTVCAFRDQFEVLIQRLSGLSDADIQIATLGNTVSAKFNGLSDMSGLTNAFTQLEAQLDFTLAGPLKQEVALPLQALMNKLTDLDTKNKLINLVNVHRSVPRSVVEGIPGTSPEKTALLNLLDTFDPLDPAFSFSLDALGDLQEELISQEEILTSSFMDWDSRFHSPEGPLAQMRIASITLGEFRAFLQNLVREQFTEAIAPTFKALDYIQGILTAILSEISSLIQQVQDQITEFLDLTTALETLIQSLNGFIDDLNTLDLSFLVEEVQDIFDEVGVQMELLRPSSLASELKQAFENLLAIIDINQLFGIPALDESYLQLLDLLESPIESVEGQLQPRFNALLEFINLFDLSVEIETFLSEVNSLDGKITADLRRIIEAYRDMFNVIPADIQAEANFSVG
ncbi:MAG: DNA circularization N-terminal domain-containing protein [Bacteroidota bacterium]